VILFKIIPFFYAEFFIISAPSIFVFFPKFLKNVFGGIWNVVFKIFPRSEFFSEKFNFRQSFLSEGELFFQVLSCDSESDSKRWQCAVTPPQSENPGETLYEKWDCPQVTTKHAYVARQPDELSLNVGDVVNVLKKLDDGKACRMFCINLRPFFVALRQEFCRNPKFI